MPIDLSRFAPPGVKQPPIPVRGIDLSRFAPPGSGEGASNPDQISTENDFYGSGSTPENPIQEQHPDISNRERFELMYESPETAKRTLENQFGHGNVYHAGGHNFSVRNPGERWRVLDENRLTFNDATDLLGDITSMMGYTGGGIAGGAVGTALGAAFPPIAPYTGTTLGIMGAGAGGAAAETAKQAMAKLFFSSPPTGGEAGREIGKEALMGMAAEGGGRAIGAIARNAPRLLTSPARGFQRLSDKFKRFKANVEGLPLEMPPLQKAPAVTRNEAVKAAREEIQNMIKREAEQPFEAKKEVYETILRNFDENSTLVGPEIALNAAKTAIKTESEAVRTAGAGMKHEFPKPPEPSPVEPAPVEPLPAAKPRKGIGATKKTSAKKRAARSRPGRKLSAPAKANAVNIRGNATTSEIQRREHALTSEMSTYINHLRGELAKWSNGELTGGVRPKVAEKVKAYDQMTQDIVHGYEMMWRSLDDFRKAAWKKNLDTQVKDGILTRAEAEVEKKRLAEQITDTYLLPDAKAFLGELQELKQLTGVAPKGAKLLREKGKPPIPPIRPPGEALPLPATKPRGRPVPRGMGGAGKTAGLGVAKELLPRQAEIQRLVEQSTPAQEAMHAFRMPPGWSIGDVGFPTWRMMGLGMMSSPWVMSHILGVPYMSWIGAFGTTVLAHLGGKILEFTPKVLARLLAKVKNDAARHGIIKALEALRRGGPKAFRVATTALVRLPAFRESFQQDPSLLDAASSSSAAP